VHAQENKTSAKKSVVLKPVPAPDLAEPVLSYALVQKSVSVFLHEVSERLWFLVEQSEMSAQDMRWACLEVSLLLQWRKSFTPAVPSENVLYESLYSYLVEAQDTFQDVQKGGPARFLRMVQHCRSLASQVSACGADMQACKKVLHGLQQACTDVPNNASFNEDTFLEPLFGVYVQIQQAWAMVQSQPSSAMLHKMVSFF
jgi:hypothetical protein